MLLRKQTLCPPLHGRDKESKFAKTLVKRTKIGVYFWKSVEECIPQSPTESAPLSSVLSVINCLCECCWIFDFEYNTDSDLFLSSHNIGDSHHLTEITVDHSDSDLPFFVVFSDKLSKAAWWKMSMKQLIQELNYLSVILFLVNNAKLVPEFNNWCMLYILFPIVQHYFYLQALALCRLIEAQTC